MNEVIMAIVYIGTVIGIFALLTAWYFSMLLLTPYFDMLSKKFYKTKVGRKIMNKFSKYRQ